MYVVYTLERRNVYDMSRATAREHASAALPTTEGLKLRKESFDEWIPLLFL